MLSLCNSINSSLAHIDAVLRQDVRSSDQQQLHVSKTVNPQYNLIKRKTATHISTKKLKAYLLCCQCLSISNKQKINNRNTREKSQAMKRVSIILTITASHNYEIEQPILKGHCATSHYTCLVIVLNHFYFVKHFDSLLLC